MIPRGLFGIVLAVVCGSTSPVLAQESDVEPSAPAAARELKELKDRVRRLEKTLKKVTEELQESELEKIVKEAEAEAKAPEEEGKPEQRTFLWGALALQKLNPEITFSADFLAQLIIDGDRFYAGRDDRSSMPIREVGLMFQHVLDPYSMFKAAFHFAPWPHAHLHVEEVYITWFGLIKSLSLSVGRFRQNFGVLNRWHEHDLDQTMHPLAMRLVLGDEGLNQSGVSIKWFMPPLVAHANELTLEITDGENETLFAGEHFSVPCVMAHLKNYYDLTENTYLELGLSGMFGVNNRRGYVDPSSPATLADEPWRQTWVFGADLTIHWSPLQQAKYRSFTWRTEYYYVNKETPDDLTDEVRQSWGIYTYVDYQLGTRWFCGLRFDGALPTIRRPTGDADVAWDLVPYLTFWQSEFVYLRLEYQHGQQLPRTLEDGSLTRRTDNRLLLQIDFAAGPHKHEKY